MSTSDSRVRIAFCITDLDPGGAERALLQLVTRLDPARWLPAVFCLASEGALAGELRSSGVSVTCLGARRWSNISAVWRLSWALRRFQPALVQTILFHANLAGRIAGRLAGVRTIISGIRVAEKRSRLPLWIDRATNWMVHTNVCVSQAVAEFSIREAGLSRRKIVVITNGVDVSKISTATPADLGPLRIPPGSQTLLTIGRLDRQKGLATLVEAAALMIPQNPNVHFLLVGEGPERGSIENLIRQQGLEGRIHFAGWRNDVPDLLAAGYALILPSLWEGMPNVVLEAMAAGLPVIATLVEGIDELVQDGVTGLVVPVGSPCKLATTIEVLLSDPETARAMGQAGRDRAAAEFSWESMTRRYEALYESLLASHRGSEAGRHP